MKAGHYLKTEIEIISITELDGEAPALPQERNFLREKTFNSELNLLVNKIFKNEKTNEDPSEIFDEPDLGEKNDLLLKCEKLIYQLKHSDDYNSVTSFYNPFETDISVNDDIDDTADYVKTGLLQSGFPGYQILKYNFNDKAYRSDINMLEESFSTDIYFNINDPIIRKINNIEEGYILKPELIKSDPFFAKKFLNNVNQTPGSFYIVKISSLFNDPLSMEKLENKISQFEEFLSPLLLIDLGENVNLHPGEVFQSLKKTAAIPMMLYFLKNRIKFNLNNYSYEDTLIMIELFIRSSVNSEIKSYIINLKDYSVKDNLFILKFFLSKIRKILPMDSMILRIGINRAILATPSDVDEVNNTISRINGDAEILGMQQIDYTEFLHSKDFVNLFL